MEDGERKESFTQIRQTLDLKSTEELIEVWQNGDRAEWSEEAFGAIQEILQDRLGGLPLREGEVKNETSLEEDETYHDFDQVTRIAYLAKVLSWIILGLLAVYLVGDVVVFALDVNSNAYVGRPWYLYRGWLLPIIYGGFFFVILQAVAHGLYILLDIEENTHRAIEVQPNQSVEAQTVGSRLGTVVEG